MLLVGTGMQTIEGVSVFPDHADPDQYWYLPTTLELSRRQADDRPDFTFIKYKRSATAEGVEGGGFLMFSVDLTLPEEVERSIRSAIPGGARLATPPFDSGSVSCVALNLEGPGGTVAELGGDGTFVAVEQILGATTPGLFGRNTAMFSLTLSAEGATLLEAAFANGATPVGVKYDLTFTAMQPALDVKITADFKRIYDHFSASLNANLYYVEVGIEAGLEELQQTGAIKIEVTNFDTDDDKAEKEQAAIQFFKDNLLTDWFTPTLTPGALQGGAASAPRAGGGAAVFGPGSDSGGSTNDNSRPDRPQRPTRPGQPTTRPGQPPARPGQPATRPGQPDPRPSQPTTRPGQPAARPAPPGSTNGGAPAPGNSPTPDATSERRLVFSFREDGGEQAIVGKWELIVSVGDEERAASSSTMSDQLEVTIPSAWQECDLFSQAIELPQITSDDEAQLRRMFEAGHSNGIVATGTRELLGATFGGISIEGSDSVRHVHVTIPTTRSRITAATADALVQAVLPGGQLVQDTVYDVRRVASSNDFLLISADVPSTFTLRPIGESQ